MTTNQKGAIAEAAVVLAATKLGIEIYGPIAEGGRYDLIFVTTVSSSVFNASGPCVEERSSSFRAFRAVGALMDSFDRPYSASEIDAVAAYCMELDRCYYVPIERVDGHPSIALRLAPARNNQRRRIRLG